MIFCNKCGKSNPEDARYCSGCGIELSRIETENKSYASNVTTPKPKKKLPTWKKVIIGILVFFFIAAIGASSGEGTDSETTTEAEVTETTKAINENVKLLMDTTGYKESVCKRIYKKLKDCGYDELGKLTEVSVAETTKSYKLTGDYHGSGMLIVSEDGLYFFSWGSDTLYDAEKPDKVKNIKDYAILTNDRSNYYLSTEDTIKGLLKAPSTADFPAWYNGWNLSTKDGIVTVSSYVDAQNSFGAMIRSNFIAQYKISDGSGIYLEFDGQVYLDKR